MKTVNENPHLKHMDRAMYELGYLLAAMPRHFPDDRVLTDEERQMAKAATALADTALGAVLHGLESIGSVLFSASKCEDYPTGARHIGAIGTLIQHLAVEAQFLGDQIIDIDDGLRQDDKRLAAAKAPRKGAPA